MALVSLSLNGQETADRQEIKRIYTHALSQNQGYEWLRGLTDIGGRLAGSPEADEAINYFRQIADSLGFTTSLQPVTVPHWERGVEEPAYFMVGQDRHKVHHCALGGSIATEDEGLQAPVVEIRSFAQLDSMPANALEGKIAFFNIPMDPAYINTFFAYSNAVKQRWAGAIEASKKGASGVITRSLSSTINKVPHTGSMSYKGAAKKIPAISISTYDAEQLSAALTRSSAVGFYMKLNCQWKDSVQSHNLIADLQGTAQGDSYILTGGHIDSWDLGTGAHDDGAGVVHALEAAWLLKDLGLMPKRNLRVVFYMNEEFGLDGARDYAKMAKRQNIDHAIALESDAGGFSPRGFSIQASDSLVESVREFRDLLEPYGIHRFSRGGAGADIGQLSQDETLLIGLRPDNHRYFEIHHTANDTFDAVNPRELEMGSASMAALIYLLDKYDIQL